MTIMTATEVADAIGVSPKAFRSFVRSMVRANGGAVGTDTPGSGKRYVFDLDDDGIARIAAQYAAHRRTNGGVSVALDVIAPMTDDDGDGDA